MHNYEYRKNTNPLSIIDYFTDFEFDTDHSDERETPKGVVFMSETFSNEEDAEEAAGNKSYWDGTSIAIAKVTTHKISKAFEKAFDAFKEKRKDYLNFDKNLTIAFGRKSTKVTCPHCKSMINLSYGKWYKSCPICGSKKIISDSNWNMLASKKKLMGKAAAKVSEEAIKCGVTFIGAIGWHS